MSVDALDASESRVPTLPVTVHVFDRLAEGVGWRSVAFLVDSALVSLIAGGAATLLTYSAYANGTAGDRLFAVFASGYLAIGMAVQLAYMTLAEGLTGMSAGKLGCFPSRLQVVRVDGRRTGITQSFLRAAVGLFESNLALGPAGGTVAALVVAIRTDNRRLGDLLAGTMVVDATKLIDLTITTEGARFEMADGREVELAGLEKASVATWLGKPQTYTITGSDPGGRRVKLRLRCLSGLTVFNIQDGMGLARQWLEWRFGTRFAEAVQWWRVAVIAVGFLVAGSLFVVQFVLGALVER